MSNSGKEDRLCVDALGLSAKALALRLFPVMASKRPTTQLFRSSRQHRSLVTSTLFESHQEEKCPVEVETFPCQSSPSPAAHSSSIDLPPIVLSTAVSPFLEKIELLALNRSGAVASINNQINLFAVPLGEILDPDVLSLQHLLLKYEYEQLSLKERRRVTTEEDRSMPMFQQGIFKQLSCRRKETICIARESSASWYLGYKPDTGQWGYFPTTLRTFVNIIHLHGKIALSDASTELIGSTAN
jgi:hypothetical protein